MPPASTARRRQHRHANQDGSATIEVVLATPVLLLLLLAIVQLALWQHAVHVADAAAQEGARAARLHGGTAAAGAAQTREFLAQLSPTILVHPHVSVRRNANTARVEVTGQALMLIPGLHLPVRAAAQGTVERFRADLRGFGNAAVPPGVNPRTGGG
jgi:Flp pilus assembly protein TadG